MSDSTASAALDLCISRLWADIDAVDRSGGGALAPGERGDERFQRFRRWGLERALLHVTTVRRELVQGLVGQCGHDQQGVATAAAVCSDGEGVCAGP